MNRIKARMFLACALIGGLLGGTAFAEETGREPGKKPLPEQRPVNEFLPYTYLEFVPYKYLDNIEPGNHYSDHAIFPYYFEGTLASNLIIFENQTRVLMDSTLGRKMRFGTDFSITPEVSIRLYRTPSLPVRHPSYRPQMTENFTWYFPVYGGEGDRTLEAVHKLNLQVVLIHYSNGDENCLFQEDSATTEFKNGEWRRVCRDDNGHTINNLDGEFTSTFFQVGVFYHYSWLDEQGIEKKAIRTHFSVDLQPAWLRLPGAAVPTQRHIYNPDFKLNSTTSLYSRTYAALGGFKYFGQVSLDYFPMIQRSNSIDRAPYVTPYGADLKLGWLPDNKKFLRGWSFYVGGYTGQDPYNIEFRHRITQVEFGFISTSSLQFRIR